ncbi:MotA/TolQ/ExbB proton channel family protein [Humisphaera borealis]|uniref:MotA/TolQ/ExbB proton channel family protein n=1 Tax=Humisphaera borealis TaxID=2807512 RepID=A0A7M2X2D7_9BACT|nr:MotA/TolQ/ExbB proton channel family protein [Humisphaera borealis]QOV91883.1 MotA/TolQ/ExbB proton channel family protein [Humisphaera borealis]
MSQSPSFGAEGSKAAAIRSRLAKFGVQLFAVAVMAMVTAAAMAQAPAAEGEKKAPEGLISIVLGHIDFIFVIIAILSVIGLTLIIQGFIKNRAGVYMPEASVQHIRDLIAQKKFKELIEHTENDPSFVAQALNPALKRAPSFSSMKEAMETSIGEQTAERFRSIEYLNIIGNLGPLLGLTGTVLGMIEAFAAMNAAGGSASPGDLAGGISRALAHTFLGLFLAVPCLGCFGIIRTIVDRLTVRASLVCEELLLMVKPQEAKPAGAPGGPPQAPRPPGAPGMPAPMRKPAAPAPAPSPLP